MTTYLDGKFRCRWCARLVHLTIPARSEGHKLIADGTYALTAYVVHNKQH